MSLIEPTLILSYSEGSEPLHYGLKVEMDPDTANGVSLLTHQGAPEEPSEGSTFQIIVNTGEEGSELLYVDLGAIFLNHPEGEIEVILHNASSEVIGKKKIRAEEAQKESRPITENW